MSALKNIGIGTAGAGAVYGGLNVLENSGSPLSEVSGNITEVIDMTASSVINSLSGLTNVHIGDFSPLSDTGLAQLGEALSIASSGEFLVSGGVGLVGGYLGSKLTKGLGKITKTESIEDERVGKYGAGIATAAGMIGAGTMGVTIGSATAGYIVGKKLAQKIMDEKYAQYVGLATGAAATSIAWGMGASTVLGSAIVLGGGSMLWKAGESNRQKQKQAKLERQEKQKNRKIARAAKKRK